jgi:hypothetical protein
VILVHVFCEFEMLREVSLHFLFAFGCAIRSWSKSLHHLSWIMFPQIFQHMHYMGVLMMEVSSATSGSES